MHDNEMLNELQSAYVQTYAELQGIRAKLGVLRWLCESDKIIYGKEIAAIFGWDLNKEEEEKA